MKFNKKFDLEAALIAAQGFTLLLLLIFIGVTNAI